MGTVGRINKIPIRGYDIEWQIPDFLSLTEDYSSPAFSFAGISWCLRIYLNNRRIHNSGNYIGLYLRRISSGPPIRLEFSLGLRTVDGKKDPEEHRAYIFKEAETGFGIPSCLSISELKERRCELVPSDILTVVCTLRYPESVEDENIGSLRQDYKKVLLHGENHDLILKVGNKELKAHQDILRARSRVFQSMLSHNMTEKNSGIIDVPDCDPQAMELFLSFVYCGKIDTLNQSNMMELYYISDKYEIIDLKEECCEFIKKSLTNTNICKIIQLAFSHSDSSLLEYIQDYFDDNVLDIMHTIEWQTFLKENPALGNELLIKAIQKLKNTKK